MAKSGSTPSKTKKKTRVEHKEGAHDYLNEYYSKGRYYCYYRRNGQQIRIKEEKGSSAWHRRYAEIHESFEDPGRAPPKAGSFGALIDAYRASPEFLQEIGDRTRKDYARYLDRLKTDYGHLPVKTMPRAWVLALRDKFADKPRTANFYVQMVRLLMTFAVDRGWRADNPASRPKQLRTGAGHKPWEEWQIAAFRKHWPADTLERVTFELLLNTGQRGQDVPKMKRQDYKAGWISVTQSKTGEPVFIPASEDLRAVLDPWLASHPHMLLVTTKTGRPMLIDYFRHLMIDAYAAAGLDNVTTHGLRYTAGTILAELGIDWQKISSILGHRTSEMVRKYTGKKRDAKIAIDALNEARRGQDKNK